MGYNLIHEASVIVIQIKKDIFVPVKTVVLKDRINEKDSYCGCYAIGV